MVLRLNNIKGEEVIDPYKSKDVKVSSQFLN